VTKDDFVSYLLSVNCWAEGRVSFPFPTFDWEIDLPSSYFSRPTFRFDTLPAPYSAIARNHIGFLKEGLFSKVKVASQCALAVFFFSQQIVVTSLIARASRSLFIFCEFAGNTFFCLCFLPPASFLVRLLESVFSFSRSTLFQVVSAFFFFSPSFPLTPFLGLL